MISIFTHSLKFWTDDVDYYVHAWSMKLELLVSELLLDLLEFINGVYLLRALLCLNSRFGEIKCHRRFWNPNDDHDENELIEFDPVCCS
jgi:hypothetical protein